MPDAPSYVPGHGLLRDKIVLVTAAAGTGIGFSTAKRAVEEGATVVVSDWHERRLGEAAEQLARISGEKPLAVPCDVRSEEQVGALFDAVYERHGRLDVLVNNAGLVHHAALLDTSADDFARVIRVNQIGPLLGMQAVTPALRDRGGGSIVNISSVRGLSGANGLLAYTATKFALRGMTKVAALELGKYGIRVNSIHPGAVATEGVLGDAALADLDAIDERFTDLPIARIGRPADIAAMAAFLASDDSAYCTGAEFVVDGGATAGVRRPNAPGY